MKTNLKNFIIIFLGLQIMIYLCLAFVEMSFSVPIIEIFHTKKGREYYLYAMPLLIIFSLGVIAHLENIKNN